MNSTIPKNLCLGHASAIDRLRAKFAGNDWALAYIANHKFRCADDVARIIEINNKAHVLNIGGAPYIFESVALASGLHVTSVDLDTKRHQEVILDLGLDIKNINIESEVDRESIDISKFDVIVLAEVFEHMRVDLIGLLEWFYSNMLDSAVLYITTPNFYYFRRFVSYLSERRSGPSIVNEWSKLKKLGHMGHVREYSKKEMEEMFEYVGFTIESCSVRNRSSDVVKTSAAFLPSLVFSLIEKHFDLFGQEFVFVLRR